MLTPPGAATLNVLIVDDYPDTAEMLAMMLRSESYNAAAATNAIEAAQKLADFIPDVLIMDIALPGIDGYDLAAQLCNSLGRKPLLIAVSGYDRLEERSQREGFDHHFLKPYKAQAILDVLADFARRKPPAPVDACNGFSGVHGEKLDHSPLRVHG